MGSYIESTVTIIAGLDVSIPAPIIIGVSFEVGIKGIVGSGILSLGTTFDIYKSFFSYSLQFELRYNKMEFYIRMKMFLRLLFIIWEKSFYLYKVEIVREKKVYPTLSFNASFLKDKNIYYIPSF